MEQVPEMLKKPGEQMQADPEGILFMPHIFMQVFVFEL